MEAQQKIPAEISELWITPYGEIDSIHVMWQNKGSNYSSEIVHSIHGLRLLLKVNNLYIPDINITPRNTLLLTQQSFKNLNIYINGILYDNNIKHIKLSHVTYEDGYSTNLILDDIPSKIVHSITIQTPDEIVKNQLLKAGFNLAKEPTSTVKNKTIYNLYIEYIWLAHLFIKSDTLKQIFNQLGLTLQNDYLITYDETKINKDIQKSKPKLTKITTTQDKFNTWSNKMKVLGLYDEYGIDKKYLNLYTYKGHDILSSIPPVRSIDMMKSVKAPSVTIPDTVTSIRGGIFNHVEQLNLGKNLVFVNKYFTYFQHDVIDFDTYNLTCEIILHNIKKLTYRLQFGRKKDLILNGTVDEIELIPNQRENESIPS